MRDLCVWEGARGASIPRALPFLSLPRPTAKKLLRSKQYERGLCGGERGSFEDRLLGKRKTKEKEK